MLTPEESIRAQDYSHPYATSVEHVIQLYEVAKLNNLERICELGSYRGISTVALAYAAKETNGFVCAIDLCDEIDNATRVAYWETIQPPVMRHIFPYKASGMDFLSSHEDALYDMIYHDSQHGNHILPELHMAWGKVAQRGVLAVHDTEQITQMEEFLSMIKPANYTSSKDDRGRELTFFYR